MYECNECEKVYTRKDSLVRHKKAVHGKKARYIEQSGNDYEPLVRQNAITTWPPEDSLQRQNALPSPQHVSSRLTFEDQQVANPAAYTKAQPFKFKHPFCMLVAGPSRSGKTQWVVRLLRQRRERITPPVDSILYCYAHWQSKYDTLKMSVPSAQFHKGLPSPADMNSLRGGILVIDDLMELAVKDTNIMSAFTEGSHHKNLSVVFLMQNVFHKGSHARTMSLNAQYMVLFKNARDQQQIQTLARQIFPIDWRQFLQYFEEQTSKPYGHVILDFHPSTPTSQRIVKDYDPSALLENAGVASASSLAQQHYNLLNPYAQQLVKSQRDMENAVNDPLKSEQQKAGEHVEAMNDFLTIKNKYRAHERNASEKRMAPIQELVKTYRMSPTPNQVNPISSQATPKATPTPQLPLTPPPSHRAESAATEMIGTVRRPPGIPMAPKDLAAMETPTPTPNDDPNGNAEAEWAEWVTPPE